MFTVNDMPPQIDASLVDLLEQAETATIGHVLYEGFVDRRIAPLLPGRRIAGTAVTLRLPHADSTLLHYATKLVRPGDIVLIDRCGDDKYACWGGGLTLAMKLAGVKAGIIDGPATDLSEIKEFDLPMWSRGLSSITTRLLGIEGAMNTPISVGGQVVRPGDAILADEQGVLVMSPKIAREAAERAIAMQKNEALMHKRLRAGEKLPDISGATAIVEAKMTKSA
ncbi:MAG: 4-hydroxy-4-methyl-2-oxoglutarate aldolase [Rhizobiales bacterium 65-9]|nr:RraA family protein [Hyphomicrobiales bacterium]OJY34250.1 MAG: 4-hydroxy-4-methyl-2-oxoglutarate aldolase [Rhizobiales bacterium 65-9]